jgi:hypothetical protein
MDVRGARALRARIDERQHAHWQTARAVQAGEQDDFDPDREHLVRLRDTVREYEPRHGERFVKVLVDGRWETRRAA